MSKRRSPVITPQEDGQSVGYIALLVGGLLAYLGAEITLAPRPHPIHWLTAGVGAITAGGLAYGVTLWRGTRRRK